MYARIEVAVRPDLQDPIAQGLLRRIELENPSLKNKIRWARMLDVYWIDIAAAREEVIQGITQVCWDRVLQWVFTGNLMPSAAGKTGGLEDLMQSAPYRPGKFWGIERRFRSGVTDHVGQILHEAFEIVLNRKLPDVRASSGKLFLLEGPTLEEDSLAAIARGIFCNELIETWTLVPEDVLKKNERFHQERIKNDLPKVLIRGSEQVSQVPLEGLDDSELQNLSKSKMWAFSLEELQAIRSYFATPLEIEKRAQLGLFDPTDVEMEVFAQTWSEHCKHKIFNASIYYQESGVSASEGGAKSDSGIFCEIPAEINGLFRTTIAGTTQEIPRPWLLSVFHDNAGICGFDDEHAFCIKVETHNSPSALDPYAGALTGIVGVNRDILGCGLGAKPIFNTNVFCLAPPTQSMWGTPDGLMHPRRMLEGVRSGVEAGGNKSGIPTINGALVFDPRYSGKPLVYCGTAGLMPRKSAGQPCEQKQVLPGDRIVMIGGRIGKDGIHGATFSSLALESSSPSTAVQLGDPLTQKRVADFLLEARDLGLYRAITDNGAGGLSSSVGEMARLSGGARMDVSLAKTKYPGLKPFELVISESQERMTLAVPPEKLEEFNRFAERRGVEVSHLGEFNDSGRFEILYEEKPVASLDLSFLHEGVPQMKLSAEWKGTAAAEELARIQILDSGTQATKAYSFEADASRVLLTLMGRLNIASKEWLIRQYDHEVQGSSVIKPLHFVSVGTPAAWSGPNDAGVVKPKFNSDVGLAVGCGINPKLSDWDPYLMAQSSVDEAIRNVLCVGAEYGTPESVLALVDNFCWPDPVGNALKTAWLVRACYGLRSAALELGVPLVSGKDSMKNDYRWKDHILSVPPTLLMTAVGRVPDIKLARTADFKGLGDVIYLLGPGQFGLIGSELQQTLCESETHLASNTPVRVGLPDWPIAKRLYGWIGGAFGKNQTKLKSLHDVSEGGLLVTIAESMLARGVGVSLNFSFYQKNLWEFCFGEGFHSLIGTVSPEDVLIMETEWNGLGIPFKRLGEVCMRDRMEVSLQEPGTSEARSLLTVSLSQLRSAWMKEGFWE